MIEYLETALGLAYGSLSTEFGVMLAFILVATSFFALIKVILTWLGAFFNG